MGGLANENGGAHSSILARKDDDVLNQWQPFVVIRFLWGMSACVVLHNYVENWFKLEFYSAFSFGDRKGIQPAKNLSGGMLACFSAWVKIQILHMAQLAAATATHYLLLQ